MFTSLFLVVADRSESNTVWAAEEYMAAFTSSVFWRVLTCSDVSLSRWVRITIGGSHAICKSLEGEKDDADVVITELLD